MVYGANATMLIEIDTPSWLRSQFNQEVNDAWLNYATDLIEEVRDVAHIREGSTKKKANMRYNFKVMPR